MKKIVALVLALMLVLSGTALAEIERISEEPIAIKVMGATGTTLDWTKTYAFKWAEENLGFDFDVELMASDVLKTQLTLMMADNDLPDMFADVSWNKAEINGYGEEGYFLDMSEYLDVMPNFVAFMESHPEFAAYTKTADGKIYGIDRCRDTNASRELSHNFISKKWLENVGKEVPTTVDELYDVLVAFKTQDANGNGDPNDEIPMSLQFDNGAGQRVEFMLQSCFGINSCTTGAMILQADENGKVYLANITDNYKNYLTWLNKLYTEGLLDNEAFIQTTDEYRAKATADRLGFWGDWSDLPTSITATDYSCYHDYYYVPFLANIETGENNVTLYTSYTSGVRYIINADTEYPEQLCKLIDFMYNPEAMELINFGEEGKTFDRAVDEFGNAVLDFNPYWEAQKEEYPTLSEWKNQTLTPNKMFQAVIYDSAWTIVDEATDEQLAAYVAANPAYLHQAVVEYGIRQADNLIANFPFLAYTAEENELTATLKTDINSYLKSMKAQFITGEADINTEWDNFVKTVESMNLATVMEVEQQAYDRFMISMK